MAKAAGQPGLGAESHGRESPATTGRKQQGGELWGQQDNGVTARGGGLRAPGRGWGLLSPSLLLCGVGAGPGRPTGAFPKPRRHGRRVGTRLSQAAGAGTAFPRSPAPLRLCPPSLAHRQHPKAQGTGIAAPHSPPGGAGPQTSSPRGGRGFPCPIPHLPALWGRQQWDLWGYSGPQIRARSSPARFPSCPFHRERGTTAGGEGTAPVPRPPALLFPHKHPKIKFWGSPPKPARRLAARKAFHHGTGARRHTRYLKTQKYFSWLGSKHKKTQPQRHGHREQHGTDPKAATARCPESTPRAPFGAGPLGIPFGAVPKSREEAEGTLAGQNQLLPGGSATAPGAARTHPAPQSRGETAGSEEGGKKPRKERPPRAVSPLLSSLCRVQLV